MGWEGGLRERVRGWVDRVGWEGGLIRWVERVR